MFAFCEDVFPARAFEGADRSVLQFWVHGEGMLKQSRKCVESAVNSLVLGEDLNLAATGK